MARAVTHTLDLDIALIGGGIAGLWLVNRLRRAGYNTALFEQRALGGEQTIASQGMIHGGVKYTLAGALSGASEAIAQMPDFWRACLSHKGESTSEDQLNLSDTRLLSDHFYLWSRQSLSSQLAGFFASKLLRGRLHSLPREDFPPLLAESAGALYRLEDLVLDVPSLVANLAQLAGQDICLLPHDSQLTLSPEGQAEVAIPGKQPLRVRARRVILCAGRGNGELLNTLGLSQPAMQLRPLQQVMVSHPQLPEFYGHCLGLDSTPRLTVSSHTLTDGQRIWYLGGSLAEKGAHQSPDQVIASAQAELAKLLPQLDLTGARWASLAVVRAEARQPGLVRPDKAFIDHAQGAQNLLVAWPTKLTLVPALAQETLAMLGAQGITPSGNQHPLSQWLSKPPLASTPWDKAFGSLSEESPTHV